MLSSRVFHSRLVAAGALSVVGATGIAYSRQRGVSQTEGSDSSMSGTMNNQTTDHLQQFLKPMDVSSSLVGPTAEATVRASRLVSTFVLMVADYKLANSPFISSKTDGDELEERKHWEEEATKRREALEDAQKFYSRASHHHLDYAGRIAAKKKEKEAMMEAAESLAEAEDKLAMIGGSQKSDIHTSAATRLLDLCKKNGGVYIKIGQHLANLDYVLPAEYISVLSSLFDDTPKTSSEDVAAVIEEELGKRPDELFSRFEPEPIASASLAQVHVAYDKETGKKLAIKVQHRGLRETSRGDIYALVKVVRFAESMFPDFKYGWLASEIAPHLPKELDFNNEGKNAESAAKHLQQTNLDCVVPKILWQHTSERVLTMEFEEGFKATDVEKMKKAGIQKRDVANLISSVFSSQIFVGQQPRVHCDPHPGNLLIRRNQKTGKPQLVLLDHGLYRELDVDFRLKYAKLWRGLMLADLSGIKESCQELGVGDAYPLFAAVILARPFDEIIERSKKGTLQSNESLGSKADQVVMRGYAQTYLVQIFELLATLPRQMLLLLKMNDCLRHIDYSLGSPTNTMVICGRYASLAVYEDTLRKPQLSFVKRIQSWLTYMHVLLRIKIHDAGMWWLEKKVA